MVKHSRKPGIKADFVGTFLKMGSALLLSLVRIRGQKQTPVHLGECRSPRRELFLAAGDGSQLFGLTTSDRWGCRQSEAHSQAPARDSTGCKGIWPAHRGCKKQNQNQNKKKRKKKKRTELLRGPLTGSSLSPSGFWLNGYPSPPKNNCSPISALFFFFFCGEVNQHSIQLTRNKYPQLWLLSLLATPAEINYWVSLRRGLISPDFLQCLTTHLKKWYWEKRNGKKKKLSAFLLTCISASKAKHLTDEVIRHLCKKAEQQKGLTCLRGC